MKNISANQTFINLRLLVIVSIVVFMFVPTTFGCTVKSVELFIGTMDTEAEAMTNDDKLVVAKGTTIYFYAKATIESGENPDHLKIKWEINYGNGWVSFGASPGETSWDASDVYLEAPAAGADSEDFDTVGDIEPEVRCSLVDSAGDAVGAVVSDKCHVYVVKADIQMQDLAEEIDDDGNPVTTAHETDPGAYIGKGNSPLEPVVLKLCSYALDIGKIVLEPDDGATIKVYAEDDNTSSPKYEYDLSTDPLDASGELTVYVEGVDIDDVNLEMTYKYDNDNDGTPEDVSDDTVKVSVKNVLLEWKTYGTSNSAIDDDDYGKRIFPGLEPGDSISVILERSSVYVEATVFPPQANVTVHFKWFDVDDSEDSTVIDSSSSGPDNRLEGSSDVQAGLDSTTEPTYQKKVQEDTDADGKAKVIFSVSRQPGNNYRVFASTNETILTDTSQMGQTQADDMDPPDAVSGTEILTVWRKLHVEVDSMGADPTGQVFDSDDVSSGDISDPDISGLEEAFKPAFVLPVQDTGCDNSSTTWNYNFSTSYTAARNYAQSYRGTIEGPISYNYWTVYILGAYEHCDTSLDNDGDTGTASIGSCNIAEPEYCFIYYEIFRDVAAQYSWSSGDETDAEKAAVVHEVGHCFGLSDWSDGTGFPSYVMWAPDSSTPSDLNKIPDMQLDFKDEDINTIRNTEAP